MFFRNRTNALLLIALTGVFGVTATSYAVEGSRSSERKAKTSKSAAKEEI